MSHADSSVMKSVHTKTDIKNRETDTNVCSVFFPPDSHTFQRNIVEMSRDVSMSSTNINTSSVNLVLTHLTICPL